MLVDSLEDSDLRLFLPVSTVTGTEPIILVPECYVYKVYAYGHQPSTKVT